MYTVLMVDDEAIALAAMRKGVHWETLNISEIYEATNASAARQILSTHPIDLLICDIEMPNGSGLDLVQWMSDYKKDSICIFLTCHSKFEYARQAVSLGVMDYLLKPVDYQELEKVIKRAIEQKKQEMAAARARILLSDASRVAVPEFEQRGRNENIAEETKRFILENIGQELSRDEVAAHVYLNPDYLSRILKKETGYSVSEYIIKLRMSVACDLLVKTELSISKIAVSCGYSNMAHFSKMFKKEVQMTPNSYRLKYKE